MTGRLGPPRHRSPLQPRTAAVKVLTQVFSRGVSLSEALDGFLPRVVSPRDRALTQDLCFGVLRWGPRLEAIVAQLADKPLHDRDTDIHCLIMIGLYQMIHTRIPPHAAVAETVDTAARLGKSWARGLVNACLRRFQREHEEILIRIDRDDSVAFAHPRWMFEAIRKDWPDEWRGILGANNERPPMCLRINRLRGDRAAYLRELAREGMGAVPAQYAEEGIILDQPADITALPGFAEGRVSIQDAAAQLAARLLDVHPAQRVLDLCAAPGGKTAHLLELEPRISLLALDHDAHRLERVRETLLRLGLHGEVVCGDALVPEPWWNGEPFDRILLDAPCSAMGVIRRHPDIKRLRRPEDIAALAQRQSHLLDAAWPLLKAGGMLLYATCSIMHVENDWQIEAFLARHEDAREDPIDAPWGRRPRCGRQILPGEARMDGFFYARIRKLAGPAQG
jgi:16S rRNA (cytosine967-C5)-methyltransferase